MSFKLLNLYLKIGKFLAITPPSLDTHVQTKWRQVYRFSVMFFIVASVAVCTYFKNFYLEYDLVKTTVCIMTDCALCALNCRVIIEAGNVTKLRKLFDGLRETSFLFGDRNVTNNHYKLKFLVPQLTLWVTTIYVTIQWSRIMGVEFIKQFFVDILESHIQFFYTFYIYTILEMILKRYAALNHLLTKVIIKSDPIGPQTRNYVTALKELVNAFNSNFGWSLFLSISFTTLQLLNYLDYNLRSDEYGRENATKVITAQVLLILIPFVPTLMVILKCDNIVEEAEEIVFLVSKSNLDGSEDLDRFGGTIQTNLPYFSAARFFPIGRSTILGIFGTVATFLIVLVNFGFETENNVGGAATNLSLINE